MASGSTSRRRPAATEPAGLLGGVNRRVVLAIVIAFAAGWAAPGLLDRKPDRPVLRWVASAAKNLLWLAMLAERPPQPEATRVVQSHLSPDAVDHGRGW